MLQSHDIFITWLLLFLLIIQLTSYSITRDNASSNDTLINAFIKAYEIEGIPFQGDIVYCTHILNIIIQDILKSLIKNEYDSFKDNKDIKSIEESDIEEDYEESKLYFLK